MRNTSLCALLPYAPVQGHRWPRPTLVKCQPGDAVLILYHTLHSSTRVDGPDPRCMVYYRITQPGRPEGHGRIHPDALRDQWSEWPGIADVIAEKQAAAAQVAAQGAGGAAKL